MNDSPQNYFTDVLSGIKGQQKTLVTEVSGLSQQLNETAALSKSLSGASDKIRIIDEKIDRVLRILEDGQSVGASQPVSDKKGPTGPAQSSGSDSSGGKKTS